MQEQTTRVTLQNHTFDNLERLASLTLPVAVFAELEHASPVVEVVTPLGIRSARARVGRLTVIQGVRYRRLTLLRDDDQHSP